MSRTRLTVLLCIAATLSVAGTGPILMQDSVRLSAQPALSANACQPKTLALGDVSGWNYAAPGFMGEDLILRDNNTYQHFWAKHTANTFPPPYAPYVDFSQQVVLAAVQGVQTTGGGPNIIITGVVMQPSPTATTRPMVTVMVMDDERPGPLDVVTNPYHIVVLPAACVPPNASVSFRHTAPQPGTSIVRGRVFAPANSVDWLPLEGAKVTLIASNAAAPRVAISGHDGSFFFIPVAPGNYILDADAPPYCGDAIGVIVPPGALVNREFYLLPSATPSGCP